MKPLTIDVLNAADPAQAASSLPTAQALSLFRELVPALFDIEYQHQGWRGAARSVLGALAARALPFEAHDFDAAVGVINGHLEVPPAVTEALVALIERWVDAHGLSDEQRPVVEAVLRGGAPHAVKARMRALTTVGAAGPQPGESWADAALAELLAMPVGVRSAWEALFAVGAGVDGARPTQKWQREAKLRVAAIDATGDSFAQRLAAWTARLEKPKAPRLVEYNYAPPFSEGNTDALKTLCWAAAAAGVDSAGAAALGDLAALCFSKIPGYGAVSTRVGNAALFALGAQPSFDGVAQLSRLKLRVKYSSAQRLIGRALDDAAKRAGLGVDDLEEMAVPSFGLDAEGHATESIAGWNVELAVNEMTTVIFRSPDGKKTPKSVPKEVKADPAWKPQKARIADIDKRLPVERERIERLYWTERSVPFEAFEARYLRHPLVARIARRLIWNVDGEPGLWRDGALRALGGEAFSSGAVSLWHPLGFDREELQVWRDLLESEGVVQPFKQAHRESYAPLDSEQGFTSSNLSSGHVLRQHQLAALLAARGWRYRLQGGFDSYNSPTLALPRVGLTVELDVAGAGDLAPSGIFLHVVTNNLRFVHESGPLPLGEVPPLIYSEVMRDVDLFVSVCSIGTDPRLRDDAGNGFYNYWQSFSVAELTATARTRREVIAHLLPKLAAANRLSIDAEGEGRFLRVRGQRADYRIHLGSGQVIVEPNDRLIYIGKDAAALPAGIKLPFEGDDLAVSIVAKAILLAADGDIKDAALIAQIEGT